MKKDNPGLLMPPPFFTAFAIIIAVALEWLIPLSWLGGFGLAQWQTWIGMLLMITGGVLIFPAIGRFRVAGTNVEPTQPALVLVTDGLFQFSRNPMYVGCLSFYGGLSMVSGLEWGLVLLPVTWLAFDRMIVAKEEAYLKHKFGSAYADYKRRTRRWL